MSGKDAREFVRSRYPRADIGVVVNRVTGEQWPYIWDGVGDGDMIWGKGATEGEAWKAAADAIRATKGEAE